MCGIAGIVAPEGSRADRDILEAMARAQAHRGPDGQGLFLEGRAGLAHRRLAIIDLATGDQPMTTACGRATIVFNGEIYNHLELRARLEARGRRFATRSDTEAILQAWMEYGPACVEHLRGMFAFAVWDRDARTLFAARDRLGKKPFHYALADGAFLFASEIGALTLHPGVSREPDLEALGLYLSLQYVPDPRTALRAVRTLPPAHTLLWRGGAPRVARYWSLEFAPKRRAPEQELLEELRGLAEEATRIRLMSEVPLGAHLSGGIDSSIVTALMARAMSGPVKTFSIGFEEEAFSELPKARAVARRWGTEHREFTVRYGHVPAVLDEIVAHAGQPFADPSALPMWFLARETRAHVTVALNGDGGDELFAGYQRYWLDPLAALWSALPAALTQRLTPWLARRLPQPGDVPIERDRVAALKRLAQVAALSPKASIVRWGSYFTPQDAARLWRPGLAPHADPVALLARRFDNARAVTFLDRTLAADLSCYLPGCLLVKADRMAMAHGLEGRSPLLDQELAQWAARLPDGLRMRGRTGKWLLRRAFADLLPPEVTAQGKQGFGVPVGRWFREGLAGWSRELLLGGRAVARYLRPEAVRTLLDEHARGRADHGKRLWALAALELWLSRHASV
ncbi:Asparagine synthetase [glutamine-hydrolyzing] 1 [Fundidesulfovibrio magnetotacticus]|uniref:asparagine synthase (glutamine-hydrolyzing) n=1 Tax=Fundidesulfovibrio magnetotacticus TaxID=2730080 RepID=A0A6V8LZT5_9BACT|nr:asparagine synthase (glutamine-hydrolyzing) [Fundidesulfovibrio magnetotacticus]GFK95728.1 Asparagine synthetase [glutamine-hydrolyzing] 1 [Fundidesulfovibrio magnetotacticus]